MFKKDTKTDSMTEKIYILCCVKLIAAAGMDTHEPLGPQELQLKCLSPAGLLRSRGKLRQGYWTKLTGHGPGRKAPNGISLIQLHGHTTLQRRLISKKCKFSLCANVSKHSSTTATKIDFVPI